MSCINEPSDGTTTVTATTTASAALKLLRSLEDDRQGKKRRTVGRPRKYFCAEDAAKAKLASDRARHLRRREGHSSQGIQFVMYKPTQKDAPPSTSNVTGLCSNIDALQQDEKGSHVVQHAILVSRGRPAVPLSLPAPLPPLQREEQKVEASIDQPKLRDEIDPDYEAAIALQSLRYRQDSSISDC